MEASYSCTVTLPGAGSYSFRVKQEDLDGRYTFSKTVVLTTTAAAYSVSPNPTRSAAVLRIPVGAVVKRVALLNVSGQIVWQTGGSVSGSLMIPMGSLPAGVYHLRVTGDRDVKVLKVVRK